MQPLDFELLPIVNPSSLKKLQYIYHRESGLKIIIYPLITNATFLPDPDELCFYGQIYQWWQAFETCGIQDHQIEVISEALSWWSWIK